jgi:hypothetical protein
MATKHSCAGEKWGATGKCCCKSTKQDEDSPNQKKPALVARQEHSYLAATNFGGAAGWSAVTSAPVLLNGQYTVTNAFTGQQSFYFLSH